MGWNMSMKIAAVISKLDHRQNSDTRSLILVRQFWQAHVITRSADRRILVMLALLPECNSENIGPNPSTAAFLQSNLQQ
jgi:hypothetical protein